MKKEVTISLVAVSLVVLSQWASGLPISLDKNDAAVPSVGLDTDPATGSVGDQPLTDYYRNSAVAPAPYSFYSTGNPFPVSELNALVMNCTYGV